MQTTPPVPPAFGNKYLVFTSFPNGFPLLDITEKQAEDVLHRTNPGVPITRDQYVYGRTRWNGRDVGVVVYPLQEADSQAIDSILSDPQVPVFTKDDAINNLMPSIIGHDKGKVFVYDRSLDELVRDPETLINAHPFHALGDDRNDDEAVTPMKLAAAQPPRPVVSPRLATTTPVPARPIPTAPAAPASPVDRSSPVPVPTFAHSVPPTASPYNAFIMALQQQVTQTQGIPNFPVLKAAHFGRQWQA